MPDGIELRSERGSLGRSGPQDFTDPRFSEPQVNPEFFGVSSPDALKISRRGFLKAAGGALLAGAAACGPQELSPTPLGAPSPIPRPPATEGAPTPKPTEAPPTNVPTPEAPTEVTEQTLEEKYGHLVPKNEYYLVSTTTKSSDMPGFNMATANVYYTGEYRSVSMINPRTNAQDEAVEAKVVFRDKDGTLYERWLFLNFGYDSIFIFNVHTLSNNSTGTHTDLTTKQFLDKVEQLHLQLPWVVIFAWEIPDAPPYSLYSPVDNYLKTNYLMTKKVLGQLQLLKNGKLGDQTGVIETPIVSMIFKVEIP